MIKVQALITLILFVYTSSFSQNAVIKGSITDKKTGIGLNDVLIIIEKTNNHSHSENNGTYLLEHVPSGSHILLFKRTDYEEQVFNINIKNNDTVELNIALVPKPKSLDEITISAEKTVSAASSIYLNKINFNNRPKNSAQDMLRLVPGLFIAQHAGGGKAEQIFIRGFDCDHGTDIATFVDGMPVNMPSHGHGQGYADLHFLIPEVVQSMSVFKGTSSPLYGDFATGAAVSFKTRDTLQSNLIQLEAGSVPSVSPVTSTRGLAMVQLPTNNKKVSSYFAADVINNRGYFVINQDFKRTNLFSKTTFQINNNSKIQFSVSGFGSSWNASGQVPERAVKAGIISRFGSIDPNEGGTTQRNNFNVTYQTRTSSGTFEAQAYTFKYRFKLFSDFTFYLNDPVNSDMIEQDDNRTVQGLNTKYTIDHKLGKLNNKFTLGTSFRSDEIENQLWHAPKRVRSEVRAHALIHQRSSSVFMNEVFRLSSHLRLEAGLRYDYFIFDVEDLLPTDSTHQNYTGYNYQSALSPKLNFIYTVNKNTQFFFNSGRGFHSNDARSSVQDKYQHGLPIAVSSEVGSLIHVKKTVFSIAFWGMDLSNELVYVGDDGTTENRGASRRYGIDFSGRSQLTKWLFLDVDVNFAHSRLIDTLFGKQRATDYYIPLAPILTSAGGLSTKFKNGIGFSLRYRYMMDRPASSDGSIIAWGYHVVDFSANYKKKHYKIGLVIENLLNTSWNEAQFATTTQLKTETSPVNEIHFTPGTPFYAKLVVGYMF